MINGNLREINKLLRYSISNTSVVIIDPSNPSLSSDRGWAIILPITKVIAKSSTLNWDNERCPSSFACYY